jgi:signal transduction histidine kinase
MTDLSQSHTGAGVRVWQPLRGPFERWPLSSDFLIALLAFVLTLMMWAQGSSRDMLSMGTLGDVGIYLCAFVGSFALLWRRSHPWQVHAVVLSASILVLLGAMGEGLFALVFSLYSLGRFEADSRASLIGMLAALAFIVTDLFVLSVPSVGGTIAAGLVIAFWYIGRRLRFRGEYLRLLEERAEHLERQRSVESDRAVAAERTRIAREMHDIVAHQVSLMTVQAGAARTVSKSDPIAAGEAMAAVEKAGRQALTEMRHLLDVL